MTFIWKDDRASLTACVEIVESKAATTADEVEAAVVAEAGEES